MDTSADIINDLKTKIGYGQPMDFMHLYKGVPVVFKGSIQKVQDECVLFRVEPPDSICLAWDEHTMILHDVFMSGIQARVFNYDPAEGRVELGEFAYVNRGFGDRSLVRVEPRDEIDVTLLCGEVAITGIVADISLTGFGILTGGAGSCALAKGDEVTIKLNLFEEQVELPAQVLRVFEAEDQSRLAVAFPPNAPPFGVIRRYISERRAEIRTEIQEAYHDAVQDPPGKEV